MIQMNMITSIDPATLEELGRFTPTPEQKVKEYSSKARAAFPMWARTSFNERKKHILAARKYLLDNVDDIASTITRDNGKPLAEAISAEILPAADLLYWAAHNAESILKDKRLGIGIFSLLLRNSFISYQPMGVIGVISPWNYPFSIPVGAVAMALMAGNCVLLKSSSTTPLVGKKIEDMFEAAGLPEFVFTHLIGGGETGEALLNSRLDKVVFTGSVGVGKRVAEICANKLVPTVLELGGKDAAIVRSDANIDIASSGVVWGAFTNAGQCCASIERVYVHSSIAQRFISEIVRKTSILKIGIGTDPDTDIGPMTTLSQLQTAEAHVEEAKRRGAKVLCGGKRPQIQGLPGYFFEPTVITDIDHSFACVSEETFGPLLPIMIFDDDQQAVQLANDSQFGLNAYIWTKNIRSGKKMAKQLRAGTVVINDSVYTHAIAQTPWGGIKHSGFGRAHSAWGFYELTHLHHTHINHLTFLKDFWWYPYDKNILATLKKLTRRFTGSLLGKLVSVPYILKALARKKI